MTGGDAVVGAINVLLASADRDHGHAGYDHVVATKDFHIDPGDHFADHPDYAVSWPRHCVAYSSRAAFSGFEGTADSVGLTDWLRARGVDEVDVVGIATDYCVRATAMDAVAEGFRTRVLVDLTAGVSPESTAAALDEMHRRGVRLIAGPAAPEGP